MMIKEVQLSIIKMPLKSPFSTALGSVNDREGIIIKVLDEEGKQVMARLLLSLLHGIQRKQ